MVSLPCNLILIFSNCQPLATSLLGFVSLMCLSFLVEEEKRHGVSGGWVLAGSGVYEMVKSLQLDFSSPR